MNPIFICGHRKCGTTLLLDLLDGHSDILNYPEDLCVMYGYYPHYINKLNTTKELVDRFESVVFSALEKKANKRKYLDRISIVEFRDNFNGIINDEDYREIGIVLNKLFRAYSDTFNATQEKKYLAIKETSLEIYAAEINEFFPDCKIIQVLRDPRDNFAAIKAGVEGCYSKLGESAKESLASLLNRVFTGMKYAGINKSIYGDDRYLVVRFEDIVNNLHEQMQVISSFLNVDFESSLLAPTKFAVPQAGNSHEGKQMFTVSDENVGRWKSRITEQEAMILEFYLGEAMSEFGYNRNYTNDQCQDAVREFYKWSNYKYFYRDSFTLSLW